MLRRWLVADDRLQALNARYGSDPEALEWARGNVERLRDRYRRFTTEARDAGRTEQAEMWRRFANLLEMQLIGGKGCVITPFDERRPALPGPREAQRG